MTTTFPTNRDVNQHVHDASDLHPDTATSDRRRVAPADLLAVELLGVSVHHLSADICVLAVDGEVDLGTAGQLAAAVRIQLAAPGPRTAATDTTWKHAIWTSATSVDATGAHLIVDLQQVRFLGCAGLSCLLDALDLAALHATALHLTGLVNPAIARPLDLTGLRARFSTHPTLANALTTLAR